MAARQIEAKYQAFFAAPDLAAMTAQLPAGWDAAKRFHQLARVVPDARARRRAEETAIDAVLQRARELMRHASRPRMAVTATWPEPGELDIERTLDELPLNRPEQLAVQRQDPLDVPVVAMLDTSLSMTGEKLALVAVAAAILALSTSPLGIVGFDTLAHVLVPLGRPVTVRKFVRRVLSYPAHGYTNIEAGLRCGLVELRRAPGRPVGVLFTDGHANVGWDPIRIAARFPRLHVVELGKPTVAGHRTCRDLARAGSGQVWTTAEWSALPATVQRLVREVFRR